MSHSHARLSVEPRLLMLDEPLGALDRPWHARLLREIRTLLDRAQLPALYVTHDHEEAFALANRIVVIRAGRVVQAGASSDVWRQPADEWTANFLGFGPAVDGEITADGVSTPWGMFPARVAGEPGAVRVVLRPDAVRVDAGGAVLGRVERCAFAGDHTEITVVAGGTSIPVRVPDSRVPEVGDAVNLAIDDDGVLVFAAS